MHQWLLVAQESGSVPDLGAGWAGILGAVGVPAILAWYLWYDTAVAKPKEREENRRSNEAVANKFSDTVVEIVDGFKEELKEERKSREKIAEAVQCKNYLPPRPNL